MQESVKEGAKRSIWKIYIYIYLYIYIYIYIYIYLCDFAKRCPLSFCLNVTGIARVQARVQGREKTSGLVVLLGVSREPRPRPIRGWVGG